MCNEISQTSESTPSICVKFFTDRTGEEKKTTNVLINDNIFMRGKKINEMIVAIVYKAMDFISELSCLYV